MPYSWCPLGPHRIRLFLTNVAGHSGHTDMDNGSIGRLNAIGHAAERVAEALQSLGWVETSFQLMPGEMPEKTELTEGAVYRVAVTAYERNPIARRKCLAHYGSSCVVCGFDFKAMYGQEAEGFIHVHHIRMLSETGKEHEIDPVKDLRPVCPNCHSVIHLKAPPYSIDELKDMLTGGRK